MSNQNTVTHGDYPEENFTESDPLNEDVNGPVIKPTFRATCADAIKNVTLEPVVLINMISFIITALASQNLYLDKVCRVTLNYTDEVCNAIQRHEMNAENVYELEIQKMSAKAMAWGTYVTASVPCILGLFVGPWSDKTGYRKVFVIIPILGQMGVNFFMFITNKYFKYLSLEAVVFGAASIEGFTGGLCVFMQTCFSFLSVITTEQQRTFRIGILNFSMTVAFPIGMGLSGIFLKTIGYRNSYMVSVGLNVINILYCFLILKDPERQEEQKMHDGKGFFYFLRTFFDLSNIKETLRVVFKKNRRLRIGVLLSVVSILFGPIYGEISVLYMNTRYRFNWDEIKFSVFQTYNFVTHTVGTIFSITVFSKYLKWHDSVLGIISTVSKIAASFVYCFATDEKVFFSAPLIEILNGTSLLAMRSIVSKLVTSDEMGKVNSIFGLMESLMPLMYVPLYTKVYTATMEVLPGFVFLMGACMTVPAVAVFMWLFIEHRKQDKRLCQEKKDSEMK